jgi:carbon-monoxide dehydrogenase small subunit
MPVDMAVEDKRLVNKKAITITVNGDSIEAEVDGRMTLADFLRDGLDLTGTKIGCDRGECGSCTVLVDGKPIYSCTLLAVETSGRDIQTVEGLAANGNLHPLQKSFIQHDSLQCGYCTPGMLMATKALLDRAPHPTEYDVRRAIEGNLCRCGAYQNIIEATIDASRMIAPETGAK